LQKDLRLSAKDFSDINREYVKNNLAVQYGFLRSAYNPGEDKIFTDTQTLRTSLNKWSQDKTRTFTVNLRLANDKGKTPGKASVTLTNEIYGYDYAHPRSDSAVCLFKNVPANDITDMMTLIIESVNGKDMTNRKNSGYIKISATGKNGRTPDGLDIYGYNSKGIDSFGFAKNYYDSKGYDMYDRNRQELKRKEVLRLARESAKTAANSHGKSGLVIISFWALLQCGNATIGTLGNKQDCMEVKQGYDSV